MKHYYKRHLPHFQPPGATLFITFRLSGSLPQSVVKKLMKEKDLMRKKLLDHSLSNNKDIKYWEIVEQYKGLMYKYDEYLHSVKSGPFFLRIPEIAQIVSDAMFFWDSKRYDLISFCIMPNHVHIIFTPLRNDKGKYLEISGIMHGIKSYTANLSNEILNRKGKQFWQHESFDHFCRDENELWDIVKYVLNNPCQAGLVDDPRDWKWSYYKYNW